MTLQTSGAISLLQVGNEFEDSSPHSMSEFYSADTGVPSSGVISLSDFYGKSGAEINFTGYLETTLKNPQNNGNYYAAMPTSAASADLIIAGVWHSNSSYTTELNAHSGWTRIVNNKRGRPYMGVFKKFGSATGNQLVCTGPSQAHSNMIVLTFTYKGTYTDLLYWDGTNSGINQWHSGNACWNGIGPTQLSSVQQAVEYYMLFMGSNIPWNKSTTFTASGPGNTVLSPHGGSKAFAHMSSKKYGADGLPGTWNYCMNFLGNGRGSYASLMIAVK